MSFLYNNLAVMVLSFSMTIVAWLYGGAMGEYLVPIVPWLLLFILEVMFFFPQKHEAETIYDARKRVWYDLKRDPLTWLVFSLLGLLIIPFANNALCVNCDRALIAAGANPNPPVPFIPFCVNRIEHLNVFFWFAAALLPVLVIKHSLTRSGKILLLELVVWNGCALALLGFVQKTLGAPGPLWLDSSPSSNAQFFSTFGYTNMAGDYFTTLFAITVGLWRWKCDGIRKKAREDDSGVSSMKRGYFWKQHYFLIPAVFFYFAALNTLSRAAIISVTSLALIFFLHTFISFLAKMKRAERVKKGVLSLGILVFIAFCAHVFMPQNIQNELDTLDADTVLSRVTGKAQYHARVATELWKDNFLFGCGGWGYRHFCLQKMTETELKQLQHVGGIYVHNDHLQFLAEHGLVGYGIFVVIIMVLVSPVFAIWKKLVSAVRFMKPKDQPPAPVQIFVIPAPIFCIFAGAVSTLVHAFGDCPLRSSAVLTLFCAMLSCSTAFLPKISNSKGV